MAIFTAVAAWAAWRTASQTKRIVQASVILQIRQQFDELGALDKNRAPKNFDLEAISLIDINSNEANMYKEIIIDYYVAFYNVMCLIITETIDKRIINNVIFPFELEAFLKIIKSLEEKMQVLTDRSAFDFWENFAKQYAKN